MMRRLEKRVALVTGAGQGIGAAIARRLAQEGAEVHVSDMQEDRAATVVAEIAGQGGKAVACCLDVTDAGAWQQVVADIAAQSGRLDILVNNAGLVIAKSVEEMSQQEWRQTMTVNLEGPFLGVQSCLALLRESAKTTPFGSAIVHVSSLSGIVGTAAMPGYTASKAGLRFFSKSIAIDFGRKGYRIRSNSVHPGLTEGNSAEALFAAHTRNGLSSNREEALQHFLDKYPLGYMGRLEDVAAGVAYLASDEAAFVTGTELVIDGGMSAY